MKIIINRCYGLFDLSEKGIKSVNLLKKRRGLPPLPEDLKGVREDPEVISLVEKDSSGSRNQHCAHLKVVEIPDGIDWEIQDYDGMEWIAEVHRTWR